MLSGGGHSVGQGGTNNIIVNPYILYMGHSRQFAVVFLLL
jgi:hypothetical protein